MCVPATDLGRQCTDGTAQVGPDHRATRSLLCRRPARGSGRGFDRPHLCSACRNPPPAPVDDERLVVGHDDTVRPIALFHSVYGLRPAVLAAAADLTWQRSLRFLGAL